MKRSFITSGQSPIIVAQSVAYQIHKFWTVDQPECLHILFLNQQKRKGLSNVCHVYFHERKDLKRGYI